MNADSPPVAAPTVRRRKRVERLAGRIGLGMVVPPLRALPWPVAQAAGRSLGAVLYRGLGRYRRVALKNLKLVYGEELDEATRVRMAKAVFAHFGQVAAEFVKLPQLTREVVDQLCDVDGEENLRAALAQERGVLLITGHFGNWEFLARWLSTHDYILNVISRRANDPKADQLLNETRRGSGAQVYNRGNSARAVLQCLKRKEIVGILPDQNAGDVFVPFFGVRTGTADGPAVLHLRTGAPILFSWCYRVSDGRYRIVFETPYVMAPSGNKEADVATVTATINARLESRVRMHPTQWLWLHDRWKSSPGVFDAG